jgi:sugar lactone lactonase YvrE
VTFDAANRAVVGLADGRVVRFASDGSGAVEELARTGGRPLGVKYDAAGRLVIADAFKGLLALGADGKLVTLATSAGGVAFGTTDDLAIAQDGTIYFTDATTRWPVNQFALDILEHRPSGRLLAYHPDTGKTEIVLAGLYFANGVAFGPDEAYVVVTETASYRVQRVWLRGERAGQVDTFADNLPGFPDNITWSPTRRAFWVAIGSPRNRLLDKVAGRPWLRKVIARLPRALQPAPERHAWALALGEDGKVVADLQYVAKDSYSPVASVIEHDGWLYLGSFIRDGVARVKAP